MKPICVSCRCFFRMKRSGFYFIEGMPVGGQKWPKTGLVEPEKWEPYKLWSGDLWECEGCGTRIVSGIGFTPVAERHHENFNALIERCGARQFQVNDC